MHTYISRESYNGNAIGVASDTTAQWFDNVTNELFSMLEIVGLDKNVSQAQIINGVSNEPVIELNLTFYCCNWQLRWKRWLLGFLDNDFNLRNIKY